MSKSHQKPICTYCGERIGTTRDHVPPKSLFAKPRPNLVTVPCCEQCQKSQSLDDEYFVRMISMKRDTVDNPSAREARDSALRSLTKPSKRRFATNLLGSIREISLYSPSGIYLGEQMSYDVSLARLSKVIERTTYGLYLHEFGERLPDAHWCKAYSIEGFDFTALDALSLIQKLWRHAASGEKRDFGENIFTYWVRRVDGVEGATVWDFVVYGSVAFLALTAPKDLT